MNIAFDIDRTVFDTDGCFRAAFSKACREHAFYEPERLGTAESILVDDRAWFNPEFLDKAAVAQLKSLSANNDLYVCTSHSHDVFHYGELLSDIGFPIADIIQCENKAVECLNHGIDFLIDDDMGNLEKHLSYKELNPHYKTKFIWCTSHLGVAEFYTPGKLNPLTVQDTYVMSDWSELPEIINTEVR